MHRPRDFMYPSNKSMKTALVVVVPSKESREARLVRIGNLLKTGNGISNFDAQWMLSEIDRLDKRTPSSPEERKA